MKLKLKLKQCIDAEDYEQAAIIRDEINELTSAKDIKEVEEIATMDLEGHAKGFVKKTARKSDGESGIILQSKLDSQKKK